MVQCLSATVLFAGSMRSRGVFRKVNLLFCNLFKNLISFLQMFRDGVRLLFDIKYVILKDLTIEGVLTNKARRLKLYAH